ncbi:MAG: hypothetical protein CSA66_01120 [Proteobacteria bacterium]|nr:MAG: hypothetical protein CSA66_01120 [Pseudomonadota bacterium]
MIRLRRAALALAAALVFPALSAPTARAEAPGTESLARIVIQHQGRLKPLESVARHYAMLVAQRSKLPDRSALDWLTELLVDPQAAGEHRSVKLRSSEVLDALELDKDASGYYPLAAVAEGLHRAREAIGEMMRRDSAERSAIDNRLVNLYHAVAQVMDMSRALSGIHRDVTVTDPVVAEALGAKAGQPASYRFFIRNRRGFEQVFEANNADLEGRQAQVDALSDLATALKNKEADASSQLFAVIPPAGDIVEGRWRAPWDVIVNGGAPWQMALVEQLEEGVEALRTGDQPAAAAALDAFRAGVRAQIGEEIASESVVDLEVTYNRLDLFTYSLVFYILAFILLALSWLLWRTRLRVGATVALGVGAILHAVGLTMRVIIMERPPVSNLYESVVFVGFVAVFACLAFERQRRNGVGILSGAISGAVLHLLAFSYASDGDTMGMLVAVLDSNFWLATHVVTITIGYGVAIVAGVIGHVYLVQRLLHPKDEAKLRATTRNGVGLALFALFFSVLGTILGGIWADQSWGRFWGWDPKENGALLICIWLLLALHGRVSGQIKDLGFAAWLVLTNITVAAAWFGVNLLSVGLHSYGFTDSAAFGLMLFVLGELLFALGLYTYIKLRDTRTERVPPSVPGATTDTTGDAKA